MNVLLIRTTHGHIVDFADTSKKSKKAISQFFPPISLLYIARSLEDAGNKVKLIDSYLEQNLEETIQRSLSNFDAVCLESYTINMDHVNHLSKVVKDYDKDIPVIIGGPHCTFNPDKSLNDITFSDICVEGEGEIAIKDIMEYLEGRKNLSNIPGVYFREGKKIKKGKPAEVIKDLDSLAFPSRHLIDDYEYGKINKFNILKPRVTALLSSRGCPFNCRFCTRNVSSMKSFRMRSAENVLEEIAEVQEKYKTIIFYDDHFISNKKRIHKIMDEIIKNGYDLDFYLMGTRIDSTERDLYIKMKKAGVKIVGYGIESGNQEIINYYNKKISLEQIKKAVKLSNEMNFITMGNFVIGAPIETREQVMNTINFSRSIDLDFVIFFTLFFQRGSDLWNEAVREGKIVEKQGIYTYLSSIENGLSNFSQKELLEYSQKAYNSFYYAPSYILMQIFKAIKRRDFTMIKLLLSNFI